MKTFAPSKMPKFWTLCATPNSSSKRRWRRSDRPRSLMRAWAAQLAGAVARNSSKEPMVQKLLVAGANGNLGTICRQRLTPSTSLMRPNGLYGVSKVLCEGLARMSFDKLTASLSIGACLLAERSHRMLSVWPSADDMFALIERIFSALRLGCPVPCGVSDTDAKWWGNSRVDVLGWRPKDNSKRFASKLNHEPTSPRHDGADAMYQGGLFCTDGIHEE